MLRGNLLTARTSGLRTQRCSKRRASCLLLSEFDVSPDQTKVRFARSIALECGQSREHDFGDLPSPTTQPLPTLIPLPERFFAERDFHPWICAEPPGPRDSVQGFRGRACAAIRNHEFRFPSGCRTICTALSGARCSTMAVLCIGRIDRVTCARVPAEPIFQSC